MATTNPQDRIEAKTQGLARAQAGHFKRMARRDRLSMSEHEAQAMRMAEHGLDTDWFTEGVPALQGAPVPQSTIENIQSGGLNFDNARGLSGAGAAGYPPVSQEPSERAGIGLAHQSMADRYSEGGPTRPASPPHEEEESNPWLTERQSGMFMDMGLNLLARQGPGYAGFGGAMKALGESGLATTASLKSSDAAAAAGALKGREVAAKELTAQAAAIRAEAAYRKAAFDVQQKAIDDGIKLSQKSIDQATKLIAGDVGMMGASQEEIASKIFSLAAEIENEVQTDMAANAARTITLSGMPGGVTISQ